jgi:hypothetical protein
MIGFRRHGIAEASCHIRHAFPNFFAFHTANPRLSSPMPLPKVTLYKFF